MTVCKIVRPLVLKRQQLAINGHVYYMVHEPSNLMHTNVNSLVTD